MSNATLSARYAFGGLGGWPMPFMDNIGTGPASAQGTAVLATPTVVRVTKSVASGSLILPSILTNEADPMTIVINDSGQTVLVYAAKGESMDGSLNGNRSVATGGVAFFLRVRDAEAVGGGAGPDWRSNVIT